VYGSNQLSCCILLYMFHTTFKQIVLTLCLLLAGNVHAQSVLEKMMPRVGGSFQVLGIRNTDGSSYFSTPSTTFYSIQGGMYYAYAHSNDMYSIGIDPSLGVSLRLTSPVSTMIQVPVFLAARVGLGATRYNESSVGFGIGVGGSFTYLRLAYFDANGRTYALQAPLIAPTAMAELAFSLNNPLLLRFHINLAPTRYNAEVDLGLKQQLDFHNWGISLLYPF
jgi:hypothetical protein